MMKDLELKELKDFVQISYSDQIKTREAFPAIRSLFGGSKRPKLSEVKPPANGLKVGLPDWIAKKQYITENVDALKYEPALMLGALVRMYEDGSFQDFSVTMNVRKDGVRPEVSSIEKPTNFFEQTFDRASGFDSDFIIGGVSIGHEEMVKVTYTETNYANLTEYDTHRMGQIRDQIQTQVQQISGASLKDWAIIRGVVILDCTYSKHQKTEAKATANASWVSVGGQFFQQQGQTNNFRLVSIDLEPLFLVS